MPLKSLPVFNTVGSEMIDNLKKGKLEKLLSHKSM